MIDSLEIQEFDYLEKALLEASVTFGEMTRHYARYLLSLIDHGVLASVSEPKLKVLIPYIEESILRERIENDGDLRRKLALELWEVEKQHRKSDENFANLIRCVLFCFETEERWIDEGTGDATPIYLYFLILKKILPDIRRGFIKSFQDFIAAHRRMGAAKF
ncbi:hypothetical protein GV819_17090 [Pseudomonas sp. Fl5BN2]|uniref:hypothetical protein n=1 Tax=unclassified Pseudomonas TaxID=196821 RepID=UPI0013770E5F|nr:MULTISPECIES: hypothetical protein [unclassified Pseudomonas]NBF04004.1 hypothetical protein [Pseudomonas sp. Fl5BN2]NBF09750.1 hypothetical protein [Pseudomonas sp. Fl4BN1]